MAKTPPRLLFPDTFQLPEAELARFKRLGGYFRARDRAMTRNEIVRFTRDKKVNTLMIRTYRIHLDRSVLRELCPWIKLINLQATGVDSVDLEAAGSLGIGVTNVPVSQYAAAEAAEFSLALLLAAAKKIVLNDANTRKLKWRGNPGDTDLIRLEGKTLGIIGLGNVGSRLAGLARALRMKVIAQTARPSPARARKLGVKLVGRETLLRRSDFVVLAATLNESTREMINPGNLGSLKENVIIVNISRGRLVDEEAVARAADSGKLFYCGDVFSSEPLAPGNPLRKAKNVLLTPHVAWKSRESAHQAFRIWLDNVERFFAGNPRNLTNARFLKPAVPGKKK